MSSARVGKPEPVTLCYSLISTSFSVNTGEKKSPHASGSGRGKGMIWKHARALLASLSTRETDQNLTYRVVWPEPNWPGGGETPSSMLAILSHPTYQGRKTNWEAHVKFTVQFTKRVKPIHRTTEQFPYPHISPCMTLLKTCSQQFLLSSTSCPVTKNNYKIH